MIQKSLAIRKQMDMLCNIFVSYWAYACNVFKNFNVLLLLCKCLLWQIISIEF